MDKPEHVTPDEELRAISCRSDRRRELTLGLMRGVSTLTVLGYGLHCAW
jgi:hypothetical protein